MKGYAYSRDDVRAKALANAYSQAMGDAFTRELKPLEVEVVVTEVGDDELAGHESNAIYRIQFDGSISDHEGYCVIGGGRSTGPMCPWGMPCVWGAGRFSAQGTAGSASSPRTWRPACSIGP
jgi:hypothetical protein